jgi:hypothetical protein
MEKADPGKSFDIEHIEKAGYEAAENYRTGLDLRRRSYFLVLGILVGWVQRAKLIKRKRRRYRVLLP